MLRITILASSLVAATAVLTVPCPAQEPVKSDEYVATLLKMPAFSHLTASEESRKMHEEDARFFAGNLQKPASKNFWHFMAFVHVGHSGKVPQRQLKAVTRRDLLRWQQFRYLVKNSPGSFRSGGGPAFSIAKLDRAMLAYFSESELFAAEKEFNRLMEGNEWDTPEKLRAEEKAHDLYFAAELTKSKGLLEQHRFSQIAGGKIHINDAYLYTGCVWSKPDACSWNLMAFMAVSYQSLPKEKQVKVVTKELLDWWEEFRQLVRHEPSGTFSRTGSGTLTRTALQRDIDRYFTREEIRQNEAAIEKLLKERTTDYWVPPPPPAK